MEVRNPLKPPGNKTGYAVFTANPTPGPRDRMRHLPFILYGAGGHAKVALDIALCSGRKIDMIIDDSDRRPELLGHTVSPASHVDLTAIGPFRFIVAIGDNAVRAKLFRRLRAAGGAPFNLVHPASTISPRATLGEGILVAPGAVINAGARIDDNVIVNTGASVDHDCVIAPHAHICPGVRLAGRVSVGQRSMIGLGSSILPGLSIGSDTIIGAGSVVTRNMASCVVAFGSPARVRGPARGSDATGN